MNIYTMTDDSNALKLIICGLFYSDTAVEKAIKATLGKLVAMFRLTDDKVYLKMGYDYICAYIDLGFKYFELIPEADTVLENLNLKQDIEFSKESLANAFIPLTHSKLNKMIGRWPASIYNSHKKNDVINDIIAKVISNQLGEYTYYTSSNALKTKVSYYKLIIEKKNVFFHDINKQRFYLIERPHSVTEKNEKR